MDPATTLLFLHIPKTAGVSLMRLLWRKRVAVHPPSWLHPVLAVGFAGRGEHDVRLRRIAALSEREQRNVRLFYGHFGYGAHTFFQTSVEYFTVIRDPIARTISTYRYLKQIGLVEQAATIAEVLNRPRAFGKFAIDNAHVRYLAGEDGNPVLESPVTDTMADVAIERLGRFPVVGITERLDESLVLLGLRWGWKSTALAAYNQTTAPMTVESVDPFSTTTHARLAELNRFDTRLYGQAVKRLECDVVDAGVPFDRALHRHRLHSQKRAGRIRLADRVLRITGRGIHRASGKHAD